MDEFTDEVEPVAQMEVWQEELCVTNQRLEITLYYVLSKISETYKQPSEYISS